MSYTPTIRDACTDLQRVVYASMDGKGFDSVNAKTFMINAHKIIEMYIDTFPESKKKVIRDCWDSANDESKSLAQRQDKIITLASLIKG